jgi:hypothetical protein
MFSGLQKQILSYLDNNEQGSHYWVIRGKKSLSEVWLRILFGQ